MALCGCQNASAGREKAILGAILIDGAGGPPLSNSAVLVGGGKIQGAGPRSEIPVSSEADRINGSGKFVVPALVDVSDRADPPGSVDPAAPEDARAAVERAAAAGTRPVHAGKPGFGADPKRSAIVEAVLEAARESKIPVIGHFATQAEARLLIDNGVSALVGMIRDTEDLDSTLVTRWRDLRVPVAPALGREGPNSEAARRNTLRLFRAGVPLALASEGRDPVREAELLAEAGVPPLDVIVAATRNGPIAPGRPANLLLLSANPGEDVRNLRQVVLRMTAGEWVR